MYFYWIVCDTDLVGNLNWGGAFAVFCAEFSGYVLFSAYQGIAALNGLYVTRVNSWYTCRPFHQVSFLSYLS